MKDRHGTRKKVKGKEYVCVPRCVCVYMLVGGEFDLPMYGTQEESPSGLHCRKCWLVLCTLKPTTPARSHTAGVFSVLSFKVSN